METIELVRGGASATISTLGAEARAWRVGGLDMLWTPDARWWDATAPVLFPVCGWTRGGVARVRGETYPLGLHGFARARVFEIAGRGEDFVRLLLRDDEDTRAAYPFAFELAIEYRLGETRLDVEARARNTGADTMPYAFGLHPGFRWPLFGGDKSDYRVRFDLPERQTVPVIAPGGLFSALRRPVEFDGDRSIALSDATFAREALCFLDARSAGLTFGRGDGRALRVEWSGLPHLVLWSRPGAPFLCAESWSGHGDPEHFEGDLHAKPSMRILSPGEQGSHRVAYSLRDG